MPSETGVSGASGAGAGGGGGDASASNQVLGLTALDSIYDALQLIGTEATSADILAAVQNLGDGATLADLATALLPLASAATEATQQDVLAALTTQGVDIGLVRTNVALLVPDLDAVRVATEATSVAIGATADTDTALTLIGRIKNLLSRIPAALIGGRLDGNIGSWFGATTPTAGQKTLSASIPVAIASDQTAVSVKEVLWEVSSTGLYQGRVARNITLIGRRTSFFASVLNDLGQFTLPGGGGASFGEMTGLEQLEIVSGSANDTLLGTGARTIKITYIDALAGGVEATVTISLNGTTPVSLGAVRALAIQYMEVVTVGTGGVAAGNITLRTTIAGTQWEQILLGYGRSMAGRYMVPTGQTAYLVSGTATARAQFMDLELLANMLEDGTPSGYTTHNAVDVPSNGASTLELPYHAFPAGTKLKWSTVPGSAAGGPRCQVSWNMLLIANT
jgi:hypothetical protein